MTNEVTSFGQADAVNHHDRLAKVKQDLQGLQGGDDVARLAMTLADKVKSGQLSPADYQSLRSVIESSVSRPGSTAPSIFTRVEKESGVIDLLYAPKEEKPVMLELHNALELVKAIAQDLRTSGETNPQRLQAAIDRYKRVAKRAGITDEKQVKRDILDTISRTGLKVDSVPATAVPKQQGSSSPEQTQSQGSLVEQYAQLEGVSSTRQKLETYFSGQERGIGGFVDMESDGAWPSIKKILYEMLTTRNSYFALRNKYSSDAEMLSTQEIRQEQAKYENYLQQVEAELPSQNNFSHDQNPGWWGITTDTQATRIDAESSKVYATISVDNVDYIQHIPTLATQLQELSRQTGDNIKVKVPRSYSGFLKLQDSLVIHFKKPENANAIQKLLDTWVTQNNVTREQRTYGRTSLAKDSRTASFSDNVAQQAALDTRDQYRNLPQQMRKTPESAKELASFAINRALELSQQPN